MDSFIKAQMNIVCTICEKGNILKWKCFTCEQLLCDDCKKYHEKLKATKTHKIVSIKEINKDVASWNDETTICDYHGQTCEVFCMDCKSLVCDKCVVRSHNGHHYEVAAELRNSIKTKVKSFLEKIVSRKNLYSNFQKHRALEKHNIQSELSAQKQKLISIIEMKYDKLIKELDTLYLDSKQTAHVVNETDLSFEATNTESALEALLKSDNIKQLVNTFHMVQEEVKSLMNQFPDINEFYFQSGEADVDFGSICIKSHSHLSGDLSNTETLEIVRTIETELKSVSDIYLHSGDLIWIGSHNDAQFQLLKTATGKPVYQLKNNLSSCFASADRLFVCSLNMKAILLVSRDGSVSDFKDMSPLLCIFVTVNDGIFVGAVDAINIYSLCSTSQRVIIKMSKCGKEEKRFEFDPNGLRLFTEPHRCIVNEQNKDIIVIDKVCAGNGNVVGISSNGNVKFRYLGREDMKCAFNPTNIILTTNKEIMTCDFSNDALDVLDTDGKLLKVISVGPLGISKALSLFFDSDGQIWIGNADSSSQAKIFIIRLK